MKDTLTKHSLTACAALAASMIVSGCSTCHEPKGEKNARASGEIEGQVLITGKPLADATVTLYAAGEGAPAQVAQAKAAADGAFVVDTKSAPRGSVFYLVAKGPNEAVALMSLLGTSLPEKGDGQRTHYRGLDLHRCALHQRRSHLRKTAQPAHCVREHTKPS